MQNINQEKMIGRYKIIGELARGGMGVVYKAYHPDLKQDVILKKLKSTSNAAIKKRFELEAKILLDLQSPYIVHLHDYFTEGSSRYIVEEFVDGMSLDNLIKKQGGALPPPLALLIFYDVCQALWLAHKKKIIHRDIKPANILISKKAAVKLADFGIAAERSDSPKINLQNTTNTLAKGATVVSGSNQNASSLNTGKTIAQGAGGLTQVNTALGTPSYMSKEQFQDSSSVDERTDIYAMGIMLYEILTGKLPFDGDTIEEISTAVESGKYTPPRKLNSDIPSVIAKLIKKMISVEKEKRYPSIMPIMKIVKKYLSQYDTHNVRVSLAQAINSKESYPFPLFMPKPHTTRKVVLITLGVIALISTIYSGWKEGFFHQTLLRHWYSPVALTVKISESSTAGADLSVQAFFFENDNDKIPEIEGSRRVLIPVKNTEDKKRVKELYTKPVFLPHGSYRVKVVVGPCIWWQSFSVDRKGVELVMDLLSNSKRSITVHKKAWDFDTGKDITQKAKFLILYKNKWILLENVPKDAIKTGQVWKFKVTSPGYLDEEFSFLIDWFQDELFIVSQLKKP